MRIETIQRIVLKLPVDQVCIQERAAGTSFGGKVK